MISPVNPDDSHAQGSYCPPLDQLALRGMAASFGCLLQVLPARGHDFPFPDPQFSCPARDHEDRPAFVRVSQTTDPINVIFPDIFHMLD